MKISQLNKSKNPRYELSHEILVLQKYMYVYDLWDTLYKKYLTNNEYSGYKLVIINDKYNGGRCNYTKQLIKISKNLIRHNKLDVIKQVMLHEFAHILTAGHKHDETFVLMAKKLGCKDDFTLPYTDYYMGNEMDEIIYERSKIEKNNNN